MNTLPQTLSPDDREALRRAHAHLEHPSLAARLTNVVGTPIETAFGLLPRRWYRHIHRSAERSIGLALRSAIDSLEDEVLPRGAQESRDGYHKALAIGSGSVGGLFGLPGLVAELPASTLVMLRSIAAIAREQGESLRLVDTRMACMEVFALGARSHDDDAAETGYYGIRLAMALSVSHASRHLARHGMSHNGAPALVHLISTIASRFGVSVSEKAAAQLVPLIGAAGGGLVNAIFIQHFQDVARSHFTVRRLERTYGEALVRSAYEELTAAEAI